MTNALHDPYTFNILLVQWTQWRKPPYLITVRHVVLVCVVQSSAWRRLSGFLSALEATLELMEGMRTTVAKLVPNT